MRDPKLLTLSFSFVILGKILLSMPAKPNLLLSGDYGDPSSFEPFIFPQEDTFFLGFVAIAIALWQ